MYLTLKIVQSAFRPSTLAVIGTSNQPRRRRPWCAQHDAWRKLSPWSSRSCGRACTDFAHVDALVGSPRCERVAQCMHTDAPASEASSLNCTSDRLLYIAG